MAVYSILEGSRQNTPRQNPTTTKPLYDKNPQLVWHDHPLVGTLIVTIPAGSGSVNLIWLIKLHSNKDVEVSREQGVSAKQRRTCRPHSNVSASAVMILKLSKKRCGLLHTPFDFFDCRRTYVLPWILSSFFLSFFVSYLQSSLNRIQPYLTTWSEVSAI